jgi:hypothetical protein
MFVWRILVVFKSGIILLFKNWSARVVVVAAADKVLISSHLWMIIHTLRHVDRLIHAFPLLAMGPELYLTKRLVIFDLINLLKVLKQLLIVSVFISRSWLLLAPGLGLISAVVYNKLTSIDYRTDSKVITNELLFLLFPLLLSFNKFLIDIDVFTCDLLGYLLCFDLLNKFRFHILNEKWWCRIYEIWSRIHSNLTLETNNITTCRVII